MKPARTDSLILRPIAAEDRDEIAAMHLAGQQVERWSPPMAAGATFDTMFDGWINADPERHRRYVAELTDPQSRPRIVSLIALSDIVRGVFQNAYIGYRTHPDLLGRGYGTLAVRLTLDVAFAHDGLDLHRVQASILPDNKASRRLAEKCGFRMEGSAERYLFIRGEWRDHLIYAVTADEHRPSE